MLVEALELRREVLVVIDGRARPVPTPDGDGMGLDGGQAQVRLVGARGWQTSPMVGHLQSQILRWIV